MNYQSIDLEVDEEVADYVRNVAAQNAVCVDQVISDIFHRHLWQERERELNQAYEGLLAMSRLESAQFMEWKQAHVDLLHRAERAIEGRGRRSTNSRLTITPIVRQKHLP